MRTEWIGLSAISDCKAESINDPDSTSSYGHKIGQIIIPLDGKLKEIQRVTVGILKTQDKKAWCDIYYTDGTVSKKHALSMTFVENYTNGLNAAKYNISGKFNITRKMTKFIIYFGRVGGTSSYKYLHVATPTNINYVYDAEQYYYEINVEDKLIDEGA